MLRVLFWLAWDVFFIYCICSFGDEMRGYIFGFLAFIALFTFEFYRSVIDWLKK